MPCMGEYGRVVGETSGAGGGRGGGGDLGGDIMNAITGAFDQVAALPTELLVVVAAILVIIVGVEFLFRAGKLFGLIAEIKWGFLPVW